jgi:hypothetical protein
MMRGLALAGTMLILAASAPAGAQAGPPVQQASNAEMKAIFDADQADRQDIAKIVPMELQRADLARRTRVKALLDAGALQTGDDFWHAAFVFQHGGDADSYLLAHTLATLAIARGRTGATWIAAASLDRYLQKIGQKQIYGTQYRMPGAEPATQEPYDRELVSDALRQILGVPVHAEQEKRLGEFEAQRRAAREAAANAAPPR